MKSIDVCLTPDLIHQHDLPGSVVVVIDILRATSCITTAISHGITSIRPVESLTECKELVSEGYIGAAERGGRKVAGFELGNSPFHFMNPELENADIAFTTTNGTKTLQKSKGAMQVVIGSFLNYSALLSYLSRVSSHLILHCAGWKGKVNLEDMLFAGALVTGLKNLFEYASDTPLIAAEMYKCGRNDLKKFITGSSHVQRLQRLGLEKDIDFCLRVDEYKVIPILRGQHIMKMKLSDMLF